MYQRLENCPICKHTHFTNEIICEDHLVSGESFAIVKCKSCHFLFTNPRPTEEELGKYYESDAYISHSDKANSVINFIYKMVRAYTLKQKVRLINSLTKEKVLWDYGCGTGDFLTEAKSQGWQVYGLEPNPEARAIAEQKIKASLVSKAKQLPHKVQVITAWHVIEHVSTLKKVMKELTKALESGGHIVLAVPNHKSPDAHYYKKFWAAYDVPRHLYHFDQESIRKLADKNGLEIKKTIPMKFDSYYVSMLSEKNSGNNNLLNAIYQGFKSNLKAKRSGEYSSLIYILRK